MPDNPSHRPWTPADPWPDDVSTTQVIEWCAKTFVEQLLLFAGEARCRDVPAMTRAVSSIRSVVTKLDQYRRMKEREWQGKQSAKSTTGENPK